MLRKDSFESLCFLYLSCCFYKRRKPCAENIVFIRCTVTRLSWRASLSTHGHHWSAHKCALCLLCVQNPDCSQVTMQKGLAFVELYNFVLIFCCCCISRFSSLHTWIWVHSFRNYTLGVGWTADKTISPRSLRAWVWLSEPMVEGVTDPSPESCLWLPHPSHGT